VADELNGWYSQSSLVKSASSGLSVGNLYDELQKGHLAKTDPERAPKSLFSDPMTLNYAMGFKNKRDSLSYDVMKRTAQQLSVIGAIIQTRCNQIANFSAPYRQTKSLGYQIKHRDPLHETTERELDFIKELEDFIYCCGKRHSQNQYTTRKRDDFETFLKKGVRDSLTYDALAFEIVPDVKGDPFEFLVVDGATIRIAAPSSIIGPNNSWFERDTKEVMGLPYKFSNLYSYDPHNPPAYIQLVNGQIQNVYYDNELAYCVRNPRSDIYVQGYGYGEREQLVTIITAHLYAEEFNRRQFLQGSAPRGLINLKGENFTGDQLETFRRQWRANVEGVENCLSGDTHVYTQEDGFQTLAKICGNKLEVPVHIWTGTSWETGLIYKTKEPKLLCRTKLNNGVTVETSPDHKFRVVGESGDTEWKAQSNLVIGDVVLVNKEDTSCDTKLICFDQEVTSEKLHLSSVFKYLTLVRDKNIKLDYTLLSDRERVDLNSILAGEDECSRPRLIRFLEKANIDVPEWFTKYQVASVSSLDNTGVYVPMYDVSVNHEDHMFIGNGVVLSNSWRTPILQAEQGVEWINLSNTNRDMEFGQWVEYLIKVSCFTSTTPVTMFDGSTKPIDQILPGDLVLSHTNVPRKVKNVQITDYSGQLVHLQAGFEYINATPEHPILVYIDGATTVWLPAKDITPGNFLIRGVDGQQVAVSEKCLSPYIGKVYNLEVEEEHTYLAHGYIVHNCAVYQIDPAELNFDLSGGVQQTPLFESSQEWKLKASKDKGLKPLLRFISKSINKHILHAIDDHYVFDFVGLDELTEQEKHELRKEQVASYMTLNEIRKAEDLEAIPMGDLPLNPAYIQMRAQMANEEQQKQAAQQQQAMGGVAPQGQPGQPQGPTNNNKPAASPLPYADNFGKSLEYDIDDWVDYARR